MRKLIQIVSVTLVMLIFVGGTNTRAEDFEYGVHVGYKASINTPENPKEPDGEIPGKPTNPGNNGNTNGNGNNGSGNAGGVGNGSGGVGRLPQTGEEVSRVLMSLGFLILMIAFIIYRLNKYRKNDREGEKHV